MSQHQRLARQSNIGVHLVRVNGHYGEPWWGVIASRKHRLHGTDAHDVIIVRPKGSAPPEKINCYDQYMRRVPASALTMLTEDQTTKLLGKLVECGAITRAEARTLKAGRRAALKPLTYKRKGVTPCNAEIGSRPGPPRVGHRLGAGQVSIDWRNEYGTW